MKLTYEELHNQDDWWVDDFYVYAIHRTDGGAVYLYRMAVEDYIDIHPLGVFDVEVFRLDGINFKCFSKHVKKWVE